MQPPELKPLPLDDRAKDGGWVVLYLGGIRNPAYGIGGYWSEPIRWNGEHWVKWNNVVLIGDPEDTAGYLPIGQGEPKSITAYRTTGIPVAVDDAGKITGAKPNG